MAISDQQTAETSRPHNSNTFASLDQGSIGVYVKWGAGIAVLLTLVLINLFVQFAGLNTPTAMNQAQIARNIASGRGFTTDVLTPYAIEAFKAAGKFEEDEKIDARNVPDIYESPLMPYIYALPLKLIQSKWAIKLDEMVYAGDRLLAFISIVFLILALVVWYRVLKILFDARVALAASIALGLTDILWNFSLAALPQMALLIFFGLAMLLTVRAEEEQNRGNFFLSVLYLLGGGAFFGLMMLAHGLAFWIFLGWLIFIGVFFRPRGLMIFVPLLAALLIVTPWLMRNYLECGNPFGIALLTATDLAQPYDGYLRSAFSSGSQSIKASLKLGINTQIGSLVSFLGLNVLAIAFFGSLLHRFRSDTASVFRWGFAIMWVAALIGMCFFRPEEPVSVNQFHVLFLPAFVGYGLAFLLVLWGRWNINTPIFRTFFISGLVFLCAIPLALRLSAGPDRMIQWPPYIAPHIGGLVCPWFNEDEIIASDIPWAVAWYGQRSSLLIPETRKEFNRIHDYSIFKQNICALYITPVSFNKRLGGEIYRGRYADWAPIFTFPPKLSEFPLQAFTPLPIAGETAIFADRPRWLDPRPVSSVEDETISTDISPETAAEAPAAEPAPNNE